MNNSKTNSGFSNQQCYFLNQKSTSIILSSPINSEDDLKHTKEKLLSEYNLLILDMCNKAYGTHAWALTERHASSAVKQAFFIKQDNILYLCGWYNITASEVQLNKNSMITHTFGTLVLPFGEGVINVPNTSFVEKRGDDGIWYYNDVSILLDTTTGLKYPQYHVIYDAETINNIYVLRSTRINNTYSAYKIFKNGEDIKTIPKALGTVEDWPGIIRITRAHFEQKIYDIVHDEEHTIFISDDGYLRTSDKWYSPYIVTKACKNPFMDKQYNYYYFSKTSMQIYEDVLSSIPESAEVYTLENLLPYDTSVNYCIKVKKRIEQTNLIQQFQRSSYVSPRIMDVLIPALVEYLENNNFSTDLNYQRVWPSETREALVQEIMYYFKIPREMVLQKLLQFYGPVICHISKEFFMQLSKTYEAPIYRNRSKSDKIKNKWKREAIIYNLVYSYYPDALFQYRAQWLDQLSLDIYIPSIKVAIEYQGQQHYQAVDYFGGEHEFHKICERDIQKKALCNSHGVTLLEWPYTNPPVSVHFVQMMRQIGIELSNRFLFTDRFEAYEIGIVPYSMSTDKSTVPTKEKPVLVYRKYTLDGKYIAEYSSVEQASLENQIPKVSIVAAANGRKKGAGGYQWKKSNSSEPASSIDPVKNNGSGPVYQINSDGVIVAEFANSSQAGKAIGIDGKNIRDVANGYQKMAGGYYWVFKENVLDESKNL